MARAKALPAMALVVVALSLGVFGVPLTARSQTTLLADFGGSLGFGTECLSHNDDGSSAGLDITTSFPQGLQFFDSLHTTMYVNTNGNITFSGPLPVYTPEPFPVAAQPMIAPYWADVDIRTMFGECWGRDGTFEPGDLGCETPPENGVWWWLEPGRIVVTWDRVGYYDCHDDLRMSFQLILSAVEGCSAPGDFDVEFRYNLCEWHTGDASEVAAQAGFDAGNQRDYVEIPGSRTDTINQILCYESNVEEPGIWRYEIRAGQILCPDAGVACATGLPGACVDGVTLCTGVDLSELECVPLSGPSTERCDLVDNDCDGDVDEDEDMCDAFQICVRGHCVDMCSEFGCPEGQICGAGELCVDELCVGVTCGPDERCEDGECLGACDGILCPVGQICSGGRCLDPCETLTCDDCTVCVVGVCVPRCQFAGCAAGESCEEDGRCIPEACADVDCEPGTICVDGLCRGACDGVVCPRGQVCESGWCVSEGQEGVGAEEEDAGFDGGGDTAGDGDGGGVPIGYPDSGVEGDADMSDDEGSGCCRLSVADSTPRAHVTFLLFILVTLRLLRRP